MSNYDFLTPRKRKRTLFIVEGNHEKNVLMRLLRDAEGLETKIEDALSEMISGDELQTAKYLIADVLKKAAYCGEQSTYYAYMRTLFQDIIKHNIRKARSIVGKPYNVEEGLLRDEYEQIDFSEVLEAENECSRDVLNGVIKVLNTSVLFVPDYKFSLISD